MIATGRKFNRFPTHLLERLIYRAKLSIPRVSGVKTIKSYLISLPKILLHEKTDQLDYTESAPKVFTAFQSSCAKTSKLIYEGV